MRKIILSAFGILLLSGLCGTAYLWLSAPQNIENKIQTALSQAGFDAANLPTPESKLGQITYKNIQLDEDRFSTVGNLTLKASPLASIFGGTLDSITIKDIDLTGELADDGKITIAGWNGNLPGLDMQTTLKTRLITLENARLSLLSEKWGGIALEGDIQLTPSKKNSSFQARLKGAQKQLSADAKIEGQLTNEGFWDARIELEKGKFKLGNIKTSRLAGLLNLNGRIGQDTQIIGELQSGGLNVLDFPWQNGALTIDGTFTKPRMIVAAKSAGYEGLELGLTVPNIRFPNIFSGQIHIEKLSTAFDYLDAQKKLPIKQEALALLKPFTSTTIQFAHQNDLTFKINDATENIDINGKFIIKENGTYTGKFSVGPAPLSALPNLQKHFGTFSTSGEITQNEQVLKGHIETQLNNANLNYGALALGDINGTIDVNNVETLSGPLAKDLTCALPNLNAAMKCTVSLQFKKGTPLLTNLKITGPGISLNAPQAPKAGTKTLVSVDTIDIKDLLDLFNIKTWNGTGLLQGTFSLNKKDDALIIDSLHLKNQGVGILKLTDDKLFKLMNMEELEKETMKLALENFQYDLLEIKASGTFPNNIKISVFGKGKNPGLLQGRTFSLDFELQPDLLPIVNKLLKQPKQP